MYSMSALVSYEPYVDNCIGLLQRQLAKFASERSIIDVGHWMQCYAFDVIGEITVSVIRPSKNDSYQVVDDYC